MSVSTAIIISCVILILFTVLCQSVYLKLIKRDRYYIEIGFTLLAFTVPIKRNSGALKIFSIKDTRPLLKCTGRLIKRSKLILSASRAAPISLTFTSRLYDLIIFALFMIYYKLKEIIKRGFSYV